jgi:hypothetical protein
VEKTLQEAMRELFDLLPNEILYNAEMRKKVSDALAEVIQAAVRQHELEMHPYKD